jgi:signal peptide peptidase SppA
MKHSHLLAYALSTPWALMPERMAAYAAVIARHYAGQLPPAHPPEANAAPGAGTLGGELMAAAGSQGSGAGAGGIAVVPVFGAIVEWGYQIDICDGGTSARSIARALAEAEADPTVGQILMVYNTPGGSVYGIQECADVINRVKASKPVIGVAQSLAASGGYWLLAQCTEAYCTPGGEVGSIGVYSGYENISEALKMAGVSVELFSAGKYKTELSPFGEDGLSDEARAYQQQRSQDYYGAFTKAVSKGRKVGVDSVRNGMGQGRVLGADAALAEKMIDGVMPMEEVLRKMQRSAKTSARSSSADALLSDNQAAAVSAAARAREIEILSAS